MPPITPDRWRILSPYLDQALDVAADERGAWLAALAARDRSLAAELESLLSEHARVHEERFLDHAVVDPRTMLSQSLAGQTIGAYRLLSLIGQGGTGSVWLAERCDGRFQGRAAVKLLNLALVGRSGEDRFKREGTILARLRHPSIAHLVDAGVSPAGQPYLVIEHVDGLPIDRYCDERGLGIEARLRLFLDVLAAVAHAHANLIVHRDIKPANVFVSLDGQVKLLDFGIAKLVERDAEWGADIAVTREGVRALTPEYAAPEQLAGGAVTTATDIYALGVLLYILLSGRHPAGDAVQTTATLVRAIMESDPSRLSDAVSPASPDERLARHATRCHTTPARLRRTLRGDLDTIVAKALKKDPAERYPSVTAMADDIRRYLRHEPIGARPDALGYRSARFVRRHWRGVAISTAVVVLIGTLTSIYTVRLARERDRAQRETAKAVTVSELMMGVLTSADPYAVRATPGEPTARGILVGATEQVRAEMSAQPELQAEMLTMMGRTYRRIGMYERAQQLLEEALGKGRGAFGDRHVRVAATLHELGVVFADNGDYDAAGAKLEQALEMRRALLGPDDPDVAVTMVELGRVYQDRGLNQKAEPLHREALDLRRRVLGAEHREVAVSLGDLASVLRLNGDLEDAQRLLRQSLQINRKTRGDEHPNTAVTMHDLALIDVAREDYRSAEIVLRHALEVQRKGLGPSHPVIGATLNSLARVLLHLQRPDEAAAALQEALEIVRPALGPRHQLVAIYALNRAAMHMAKQEAAAAETLIRDALKVRAAAPAIVPVRRRTMPADDWSPGAAKSLLGAALLSQKRFAEAEAVLLEAQDDLETMSPARPDELMATIARLADLYATWGKRDEALKYRALLPTHATLGGRRARFDRLIAARGAAPARRRPVSAR